jgi:mannose-6-phosphate isomerase-like protein (cupin superfamily)
LLPGVEFALSSRNNSAPRALLMGFRIPEGTKIITPAKLDIANANDVKLQLVGNHPPSTLYRLLMGDTNSTRDRVATGHIMKSLFIMEFDTGGTNFPHHHETQEEIYILLNGEGEMVAGGGADGIEGRFTARAGDAYYYRANTTVGFYNSPLAGEPKARILAVRSTAPMER